MSTQPATAANPFSPADRFAVRCELLRLSTQPSGPVLVVQFLLDCGVAALFAWQFSPTRALIWIALIAVTTLWRGVWPQRLPATLTPENLPPALRQHMLRIAVHEGAHGAAGVLLFNPQQPVAQLLLAIVIMGMTLSSAFSVSYHTRTMQVGITLLLAPLIVMSLLYGTPSMMALGVLGIGLLATACSLVAERARQLELSIGQRHSESTLREQALAGLRASELSQTERLRFFSAANHDLRQPVMAIGLQIEVLRRHLHEGGSAADVQRTVESLALAQHALETLTNQLLEIGRIEAAADPLVRDAVALAPLLDDVAQRYGAGRVRVLCPAAATAWTDAVALRRIVGNLTDNAVKFTPRGRVLLVCRKRTGAWRVEVRDNGSGIPLEAQGRVFDDFEQVGNTERNLQRGHGLGLAIVRRLAARLELTITLRSAPGRGSVFAFNVQATAPRIRPRPEAGAVPPGPAARPRPGLAVLVVEDNVVVADSLAAVLRQWGAVPRVYGSAAEALALADIGSLDAALCDIRLPGEMDGITLADRLGRLRPTLSIALVSADIDGPTQALARERGWFALQKPVQPAQLQAVLLAAPVSRDGLAM